MKLHVTKDTTSKILHIFVQDSSSTTGAGFVGLTYDYTGLVGYYVRPGDATSTQITLADISTLGTFVSGGFKEFDATNMPGVYEIHLPNAALSSGADQVVVMYHGAADMAPVLIEIQLTNTDLNTSFPDFFDIMQISSIGYVSSNIIQISGDTTAADNLELFFDNTGFNASNSTIGTVTNLTEEISGGGITPAEVWGYASRSLTAPNNFDSLQISSIGYVSSNVFQFENSYFELINSMDANITSINGNTTPINNLEDDYDGTGYNKSNSTIGTVTDVTNQVSGGTSAAEVWGYVSRGLTDPVDLQTATQTSIDAIEADTNEIQGKLPTGDFVGTEDIPSNFDVLQISFIGYVSSNLIQVDGSSVSMSTDISANVWGYASRSLTDPVDLQTATQTSIDAIEADTNEIQSKLPTGAIADESNVETHVTASLDAYDGVTRTEATSDKNEILAGQSSAGASAAEVWGYVSRSLTEGVDVLSISGDTTAADNAELFFDNTGFNASNSTIGTVTDVTNQVSGGTSAAEVWGYASRSLTDPVDLQTATQSSIDAIEADTNEIQGKLPTGTISDFDESSNTVNLSATTESQIDAIETDTNEIQGKLPTGAIADESNVETHVTASLDAYDGVTRTEATSDKNEILAGQSSGGITPAEIWTYSGIRSLNAEVDLGSIKGTSMTESNAGNLANNFETFFDVFPTTTKDVDDVGTAIINSALTNADIVNIWSYGYRSLTVSTSGGDGSTATVDDVYADTEDIKKIIQARAGS